MNYSLAASTLLALLALVPPIEGADDSSRRDLSAIIVAGRDKSGTLTIDRHGTFKVVFTNRSAEPIRLWEEQCQEGYETLSFDTEDSSGFRSWMHKRPAHPWDWKDHPLKTITVLPGASTAWDVSPSAIWGERVWKGVPEPNTEKMVTLTAILEIKATDAGREHGVWTGRVTSEPIKVLVVDTKLRTPHDYLWADCPKQALGIIQADRAWIMKRDDMERTPLHLAARLGFVEVARWLLLHDAEVNARAYNRFTPLLYTKHPEIVKLLLEHKADVNAKNASGRTALEEAASDYAYLERAPTRPPSKENARAITKMLLAAGAEYDIRSACYLDDFERVRALVADKTQARDKAALLCAATSGRAKIVKLLLDNGADPEDADYGGLTISYFALDHPDILKLLFDAGANPRVRVEYHGNGQGPQGSTLLHEAVEKGNLETVKLLVSKGLDVKLRDSSGATPLNLACRRGHVQIVEWLLGKHPDAKASTKRGWTPMAEAADAVRPEHELENARHQAVIRALEKAGVELDIFAAIACNDVQRVRSILQKDPKAGEARNPAGRPVLHRAVTLDRREIVKLLLEKGTNPDIRSKEEDAGYDDETALLQAAFWGRLEIAQMLIEYKANVNAKAARGVVPLHEAARMGHVELARLLLMHGADVNAKDDEGQTPLNWASLYKESPKMIKLLQDHGGMR
jgi:ankyrin repeat protein